jgi:hypothetical protein
MLPLRAPAPAPAAAGPPGRSDMVASTACARGVAPPGRRLAPVSHSWLGSRFMGRMGPSTLSSRRDRSGGRLLSRTAPMHKLVFQCEKINATVALV